MMDDGQQMRHARAAWSLISDPLSPVPTPSLRTPAAEPHSLIRHRRRAKCGSTLLSEMTCCETPSGTFWTIAAGRDVRTVHAKHDIANGTITAGRNVLTTKAQNDIVDTRVESGTSAGGGYIGKVQAVRGDIVDPHIVAGQDAGPDGVYGGDGAADDVARRGDVRGVYASRGLITSSDATEDFIVAAEAVKSVKDRRGRHDASWGQTRIIEG